MEGSCGEEITCSGSCCPEAVDEGVDGDGISSEWEGAFKAYGGVLVADVGIPC